MSVKKIGSKKYRVTVGSRENRKDWIVNGTRREADDFEAQKKLERAALGAEALRTAPRFSDFCVGRYKVHAEAHLARTTWSNRQYQIANLCEFFGDDRINSITAERVGAFQATQKRKGLSPRSINNDCKVLLAVLTHARTCGILVPPVKVRWLKTAKGKHASAWTDEEMGALFAAVRELEPEILPLVMGVVNAGLRKGEAIASEKTWIAAGPQLRIWPSDAFVPKGAKPREVPLTEEQARWFLVSDSERWCFPAQKPKKEPEHRRYAFWPKRQFNRCVKAAGLAGGPHKLRHTYATHFLRKEPDLYLLARLMGHSNSKVTELYGHLLPDHLAKGRGAVDFNAGIGPAAHKAQERWK